MPTFQMDTACTAVMTSREAIFEFVDKPKAATIPKRIGTTAPARAVADGTKNASSVAMAIAPMRIFDVLSPASFITQSANRSCKPVACIAPANSSAAATSASAEVEKPCNAAPNAAEVPTSSPVSGSVDKPNNRAIILMIKNALTGYETASVTHSTMAKAKIANATWPSHASVSIGNSNTPTSAATASKNHTGCNTKRTSRFFWDCSGVATSGTISPSGVLTFVLGRKCSATVEILCALWE